MNRKKTTVKTKDQQQVLPHGDLKIAESRGLLEQTRRVTTDILTKVKSHSQTIENQRRIQEEKQRKERANKIQTEVITSHKKNVEIDWTWQELEEKEDCEELAKDIEVQKEACKQIILQKEELIKSFMEQLSQKEDDYVKAIKKQNDDIDDLIKAMLEQYKDMRNDYHDQLERIEQAFVSERTEILTRNGEEIDDLFKQHRRLEEEYMAKRRQQEDSNTNDLEKLRTQDANDQAEQKIKLEKEMQILQKCMEDMKAVYKLNQEKLDFNHKVLQERESVNTKTIKNLKKRENKCKETYRDIKEQFKLKQQKYANDNAQYTKDYKKFTKEFLLLQKKFERFELSDKNRFNEIWSMNQNEAQALCEKIKDCDRVIHVQQLGIAWTPPSDPIFKHMSGGAPGADAATAGAGQSGIGGPNSSVMDSSKQGMSKSEFQQDDQMSQETGAGEAADIKQNFFKVKNVFTILIEEAPYLIDDKAFQMCEGKSKKEQFLIQIDSIRKSLGIEAMEDVQLLVDTFYEFGPKKRERLANEELDRLAQKEEQASGAGAKPEEKKKNDKDKDKNNNAKGANNNNDITTFEEEEDEEKDPNQPDIDLDDVVEVLQDFNKKREEKLNNQDNFGNPQLKKKSNFQTEEQKQERQKKEERIFWERLTKVLSDRGYNIWRALDKSLAKYYALLVDRQNLIEETGLLNQQNEELKTLLNQYLQAGVNHDLQVPPTQVIRLDI